MLEQYDGKLSRTVLRGEGSREAPALPGVHSKEETNIKIKCSAPPIFNNYLKSFFF